MSSRPLLETIDGRLQLRDPDQPLIHPIFVDFMSRDFQRRAKEPRNAQLLAKALGLVNRRGPAPTIIDATAGLGTDSALLAVWGCEVTALERSELIFKLLEDGHRRALNDGFAALGKMRPWRANAEEYLIDAGSGETAPDIIFVDPMYPDLKKTALPRKEMQILRNVLQPSTVDEVLKLLETALRTARERVVIKRPPQAALLTPLGRKPNHSSEGKAVRYDIYLI